MDNRERAELLREELDRMVRIVSTEMHPDAILVFGSLAHGRIREWSDLDVVVIMETTLPFLERLRVLQRQIAPKVGLDLLVYTPAEWAELKSTRPFVRDEIAGKARTVYERPAVLLRG